MPKPFQGRLVESGDKSSKEKVVSTTKEAATDKGTLIASAQEVRRLRKELGDNFLIITPGIRPAGFAEDDQQRIGTPQGSITAGASAIIVGRPITQADDPAEVAHNVAAEITSI